MSKKIIIGLVLVASFAACQRQQPQVDTVVVAPEPVYQGKFGAN